MTGHAMLAALSGVPEIAIEKKEADDLSAAFANVARHYNVPAIAQQTKDWISLIMVAGTVYGTRVMAYNLRKSRERPPPKTEPVQPAMVVGVPQTVPRQNGAAPPPKPSAAPKYETVMTEQGEVRVRVQ